MYSNLKISFNEDLLLLLSLLIISSYKSPYL